MTSTRPKPNSGASGSPGRRQFLKDSGRTLGIVTLFALGLGIYSRQSHSLPAEALRPPGALEEDDFLSSCLRCGLCVRDCPFDTLDLAKAGDDVSVGTPYFTARDVPCEMCDDIPCVAACPSGALDKSLVDIDEARMGLAVLIDHENCLNFQGLRCDVCYRVCPAIDEAITLEHRPNLRSGKHALFIPTVNADHCTGCGKCEHACVLKEAAIKVFPLELARGKPGEHYRYGWEEKNERGSSLVAPDREHRYNLPSGQSYDFDKEGLIFEEETNAVTPFASDPLKTLNQGLEQAQ
ncbi:MAG: ferredoxin-type protein NapG [Gammaproteobacteria bacterium]|nr:MAG: ferredoxin-type protein NapG [Gammaproteobacteria bacterium]